MGYKASANLNMMRQGYCKSVDIISTALICMEFATKES